MEEIYKEMKATPLLSISVPTWNRAKFLAISLESFLDQMKGINPEEVELFVSDNCSDDNTAEVVKSYIDKGLPITYSKNEENIGASRNFLRCMQRASGKYILLLGDDDVLNPGTLKFLLDILRGKDYGLVHIHQFKDVQSDLVEYDNLDDFYKQVSYWFTFVSGSIFRKDIVSKVNPEPYINSRLLQLPYFIMSATLSDRNLLVNKRLLTEGLDGRSNGGYNFYEVFVKNYLNIWKGFVDKGSVSEKCYKAIKKDIYVNFITIFNYRLLVKHDGVKKQDDSKGWSRNGFAIEGAKEILFSNYGKEPYFYWSMVKMYLRKWGAPFYHLVKK